MARPSWDEHWLNIAKEVSKRATCMRRHFGAVIVKDNTHLSDGYCGAPRGTPNCIDMKKCYRTEKNIEPGKNYEKCRSVHAEMNAVINAAKNGIPVKGAKMYLYGENPDRSIVGGRPCMMCRRVIINSELEEVIVAATDGIAKHDVKEWVKSSSENPFKELDEAGY
ncbi:cytidine deaminase [Candidatus Pacearchaeota archaeon]|nr:cytidine deaminase [Candidatus Pacearchaeota archaeon]